MPSLCYLRIPEAESPGEAWKQLLHRPPRPLEWGELSAVSGAAALERFDFSARALEQRQARIRTLSNGCVGGSPPIGEDRKPVQHVFRILPGADGGIEWRFRDLSHRIPVPVGIDFLGKNLLLKMLMNTHSTLVMGRLGRYEDNLMTYVAANNFKLIDRAVRYTRLLLERHHGLASDYETVARRLLEEKERLGPDEPIVLNTVAAFLKEKKVSSP